MIYGELLDFSGDFPIQRRSMDLLNGRFGGLQPLTFEVTEETQGILGPEIQLGLLGIQLINWLLVEPAKLNSWLAVLVFPI